MNIPKGFAKKKGIGKKIEELLNFKPKDETKALADEIEAILKDFNEVCSKSDKHNMKKAAELAYALAIFAKRIKDYPFMEFYANKSIEIYKKLDIQTMKDACSVHMRIHDIPIPELMHERVVIRDVYGQDAL